VLSAAGVAVLGRKTLVRLKKKMIGAAFLLEVEPGMARVTQGNFTASTTGDLVELCDPKSDSAIRKLATKKILLAAALVLPVAACAEISPTQQRALTGMAGGAGIGAVAGAIGGNAGLGAAAGAGAGLLGGLIFDQHRRAEDRAFQQGYAAGRQGRPPLPPQSELRVEGTLSGNDELAVAR
jgi:hypothetical protein